MLKISFRTVPKAPGVCGAATLRGSCSVNDLFNAESRLFNGESREGSRLYKRLALSEFIINRLPIGTY